MNRLILIPLVFLWTVLTAQAQFYNNGLITNSGNVISDSQLPWVNATDGVYNGSGSTGVFEHRGPSVQTFTNNGTYSATAGHTDRFTGPGGSAGAQEIAGNRQPLFHNLHLNNGASGAINITNSAGVLVGNQVTFANGITTTLRTNPTAGALRLGAGASYTGGTTDAQHVNGYVTKTGSTAFTFPVGSGTDVRTLTMSAPAAATDQYTVAWMAGDPTITSDPTGTPALHPITSLDETAINRVSRVGQWDWVATSGTGAGLTISVSIPDMTTFLNGLNEFSLRLVGWNGTRWINLSTGVKPYREGTSYASGMTANSTLDGTLVAGITAIGIGFFRTGYPLGGTVFYDGNGLRDGRVEPFGNAPRPLNGTDVDPLTPGAQPLYTTLVNSNGVALLTVPVTTAGTFSFSFVTPGDYSVVLSTNPAGSAASVLPGTVVSTGEKLGSGGGNDGIADGIATDIYLTAPFNEVNFAVNRIPIGKSTTLAPQSTPGPGIQVPVPATAFGGIDLEDGPFPGPENSTYSYDLRGLEVTLLSAFNGTVYYAGNPVSAPLVIPDFNPDQVTVSVANAQTTSVSFQYAIRDNAGLGSGLSIITLPFTGLAPSISGTVFADGNGSRDGIVNGTPINGTAVSPINGTPVPIYVSLVQLAQGGTSLVATVPVTATGTYSFTNLPVNTSYNLVLTTNPQGSATVSSLPTDWASTGEIFGGLDIDGTVNGVLTFVRVNTTPVTGANFGINRRPQVSSGTDVVRLNPAGAVPVSASLLIGSDFEDGPYPANMLGRTVSLSAATGGTLSHNGQPVSTVSVFINGFSPAGLTVDPTAPGATTVTFAYQIQDNAGVYSAPGLISVPFVGPTVSLSGGVFDDGNGLTDNLVNQIGNGPNPLNGTDFDPAVAGSQALFATLVNSSGTALGTVPVTATGTYSFTGVSAGTYSIVLGTNLAGGTAPVLPNTWVNTGEKLGTGTGSDGMPDGILTGVVVGTTAVGGANFGINKRPMGATASVPPRLNPGGNTQATIPATAFTGTDLEDGTYPNNLTGREVTLTPASGGTLYYAGNPVSTTTAFASFDPTKVTVDPTGTQATTVQFTYLIRDNAGTPSSPATTPSFITASFTGDPIVILGTVFDDANGRTDNTVNGSPINGTAVPPITGAPVPLYVSLALETTLIATVPVTAAGTYSFSNVVGNRAYNLVLTTNPAGDVINSTLPTGWVNTGAFVGTGPGNTGTFPGVLGVSVGSVSISNANFGIDRRPVGATVTLTPRSNPGGNVQSPISATAFTATDLEDGFYPNNLAGRAVTLSAATGGTLYYNNTPVSTSLALTSFDPTKVSLDPTALGTTTATFTYSLSDNAGVASLPATVTVPFQPTFGVAGRVVNDGNGLSDGVVNQTGTNPLNGTDIDPQVAGNQPIYAVLIRNGGTGARVGGSSTLADDDEIVAVQPVSPTGSYAFTDLPDFSYSVVLSTNPAGSLNPSLPQGWVSTGEQVGNGPGSDGQPNGQIYVGNYTNFVSDANFGIDKRPVVNPVALAPQGNPGGSNRAPIPARAFTGSDLEDGPYSNNLLGRRVTLNPAVGGRLYYNDAPVNAPLEVDEFDPDDVDVDPDEEGESFVAFSYAANDNAGIASEPASVTQPFTASSYSIAGTVFNDGNGLTDNTVNQIGQGPNPLRGTDIDPQVAGNQPIYAVLFRLPNGEVITTVAVTVSGTYSFTGLPAGTYAVALDNSPAGNRGQLWPGWESTGEFVGSGPGSDGNPDGILTDINLTNADVVNANFGINKKPLATPATLTAQAHPGGNVRFLIPANVFTGNDLEDGTYANNLTGRRVLLSAATNGTLYYNGAAIALNLDVASFDPTKLTVDPTAVASTTVSFDYTVYDDAGVSSESVAVTIPFRPTYTVSGRVFNDGNGLTDNRVNQIGLGPNPLNGTDIDPQADDRQPIYVVLADNFDFPQVLLSVPVTAAGTYSLTGVPAGTYSLQISAQPARLPINVPFWLPTGEFLGSGPGSDGNPDGILTNVQVTSANVGEANFGLDKIPRVADVTLPEQPNPGGTVQVPVSATAFSANDLEDGIYPNNLTGRRVELVESGQGTVYYNGNPVFGLLTVERFDPTKVTVDPTVPEATTVILGYLVYDDAGQSSSVAQITVPFTAPSFNLSGRVFNDGNGLSDNRVNQSGNGPNPLNGTDIDPQVAGSQPIYAVLSRAGANPPVAAVVPVTATGTYSFTGLAAGTYSVALSTDPAGTTLTSLPTGWFSTSEQLGDGPGSDGSPDGRLSGIEITRSSITDANFGINKQPRGADVTLANQPNPGGTVQVPVSATAFTGNDLEDGTYANNLTGRAVVLNPAAGGTLYYNNTPVSVSAAITSFDPTQVTLDPTAPGSTTATFSYSVRDNVGIASAPALIRLLFQPTFSVTGKVFDDGNGLTDGLVSPFGNGPDPLDGTDVDPRVPGRQPIYAVLYDDPEFPQVLRSAPVTATGTYSLTGVPAGTYSILLTSQPSTLFPEIVPGWAYTGEHLGNGPGDDGNPGDGILEAVVVTNANISEANFGIDKRPQGEDFPVASQPNPGSLRAPVDARAFNATDLEDVAFGSYPDNLRNRRVHLFSAEPLGTLYYEGRVVRGDTNFVVDRFDPTQVSVTPADPGATNVLVYYAVYDNAGIESEPIVIRMPFTDEPAYSLSGRVFNDGNGLTDNLVNQVGNGPNPLDGTDIDPQVAGKQPIYALLLRDVAGVREVAASRAVTTTGTYSFSGLPGGAYQVALSTDTTTTADRIASLPAGWNFTGKQLSTGPASTTLSARLDVVINNASVSGANFGIDKRPVGAAVTLPEQPNPRDTIRVPLNAFTGTDFEDGTYPNGLTGRRVELRFNNSGTFYYRGNRLPDNPFSPVSAGSFDPTQLTVKPTAPDSTTVSFTYAVFDDAGVASAPVTVTLPFTAPEYRIAGHVFNDGNGLADNLVNQEGDGPDPLNGADIDPLEPGNQALFAVLAYEENGVRRVVDVEPVDNAGAYEFNELPADFGESRNAYSVFVSNDPTGEVQALPGGWAYTGERLGVGAGGDGQPDGRVSFANVANNYEYNDVNFGIDRIPEAESITLPAQRNPGSGVQVAVPTTAFVASDLEDGDYADNLTGQEVVLSNIAGGTLYYNGQEVVIQERIIRFDPTRITVAPTSDGETSIRFDYSVYDDADVLSQPATVTLPFTANPLRLSGRVFNDGNGLSDNLVNQTGRGPNPLNGTDIDGILAGNQALFATLVSSRGASLSTVAVGTTGTYSFSGLTADTYSVVLSANGSGSLVATLPANWANTGEQLGTGPGSDGTPNGILTGIVVSTTSVGEANFGIDQRPAGADVTLARQDNPGGTAQVPVSATAFFGTDLEDGTYPGNLVGRAVSLSAATGGTLYYNSVPLSTTLAIASFDPTKVTLDPTAQDSTTVSFTYQVRDSAGVNSAPATITLPFGSTTVSISGNVLDDGNGLRDNLVNGPGINGPTLPLYVSLLDGARLIETVSVNVSGFFNFLSVQANKAYKLILNTLSGGSQTPSLPSQWINTGESLPEASKPLSTLNRGARAGQPQALNLVDDAADGVIQLQVRTSGVSDVIFGIEQRPSGADVTLAAQTNPGGTVQVPVLATAFTGSDLEDGTYPGNLAGRAVSLNPATGGTLYYNSVPLSTSTVISSFDPTRVTLDPTAPGSTTVRFTYQVQDNAGVSSPPATVTLPFTGPAVTLSGTVFDDGNGLTDNSVNGTGANGPALPLYASLVNNGVVATVPVTGAGAYSFTGVGSGTYSVVLSTNSGGSTTASLPANWVNTGERLGTGPGSDGTPNGILTGIPVGTSDVGAANFGIDQKPVVANGAMPPLSNPGGTNQSTVFTTVFAGSDPEDGTYANNLKGREVTLTAAAGGTLYYNGNPVSGASAIASFDPAQVKLDPTAPKETVVTFAVAVKDNAGVLSDPKTIVVPFSDDQNDEEDDNDDPDEDDGNEDPDDDDDGDNDDDGKRDDRVRLPTDIFKPILPTILLPTIGIPPILIGILIPTFPINAIFIIINGTVYTKTTFPPEGVIVRTNQDGELEDDVIVEPEDPTKPVPIPFTGINPTGTPVTSPGNTSIQPATLINNGPLSCTNTTVTLTAGGTGTYRFSAGATQVAGGNTATVTGAGTYYVIVTGPNGYQARAATVVTADQSVPTATLRSSGPLSCSTTSVTLTAGGTGTYRFGAGATQIGTGPTATVTQAGVYEVTVTAANGCRATASVRVVADQSVPTARLTNNGPLSCSATSVTLTASGVGTYRFSAGATPVAGGNTATVTQAGIYSVTVTAANGCSATAQTTVNSTSDAPLRIVNQPVSASTVIVGVTVTASVSVTGAGPVGYQWYKDGATPVVGQTSAVLTLPNVRRSDAGRYVVVVSGPCNSGTTPGVPTIGVPTSLTSTAFTLTVNAVPMPDSSLSVTLTASPATVLTTGTTTLSATVAGGTGPYSYTFSGPGTLIQTPASNTASVSGLMAGVQTFTVVVSDATLPLSQTVSATVSVTVTAPLPVNTAPIATTNASQTATMGQPFAYTVAAFTDAETPGSLTYTASISPANGLTFNPATRVISGTPGTPGVSSVTVTATDPGGLSASTSFAITVLPTPVGATALTLTASASPATVLTTGTTTLSATVSGGTGPYSYTFSGPGTFSQTPASNTASVSGLMAGVQTFTVVAGDATLPLSQTVSATVSVTVTAPLPVNTAPIATTNASQTAIVGQPFAYTVNAFGDAETPGSLTYTASISPANGLTFNPATRVISGAPGITGVSSVTVTATDPGGLSASTSFTISVLPVPVAGPPLALTLTASPTTLLTTGTTTLSATVSGGTGPYSYTFSATSGLAIFNGTSANNTVIVSGLTAGVRTFRVLVADATPVASQIISAFVSVTVTDPAPVNTAPVATANANQRVTERTPFSYTVAAFTDAETPGSLTYAATIDPASDLTFDPATRVISGTAGTPGSFSVTVTAIDPGGLSASTSFTIDVIRNVGSTPLRVTLTASPTTILTTGTTTLSATATGGTPGSPPSRYTYSFSGPGSFTTSGDGRATVSDLPAGVQTFTVVVSDATQPVNQTISATVSVTVTAPLPVNTPPVATTNTSQTAIVGQVFSYTANAFTDAETPNSLTYTASIGSANGLTFNPVTRVISGVPSLSGVATVTITATDPGGLSASTTFTIGVSASAVTPTGPATLIITSFTCNTSNGMLNSVDFVVGYSNGLFSPSVPNLFINGITASGQLGQRYTFGGFDANNSTLSVQDNASRSTYFVWDFRAACAQPVTPPQPPVPTAPVVPVLASQSATQGVAYSYGVPAFGGTNPMVYAASGLPAGLNFDPATRVISGVPSTTGVSTVVISASNAVGQGSGQFTLTVSASAVAPTGPATLTITSFTCNTSNGMLSSIDFVVGYSNGSFAPSVPNLFINGITASGQLGQRYTFGGFDANNSTLSVQDNASRSTYFVWDFRAACAQPVTPPQPPVPTAPVVPVLASQSATQGVAYSYGVPAFGGTNPMVYAASGLPAGLNFDPATRVISGVPSTTGVSTVVISASNAVGQGSGQFTLTVSASVVAPTGPATLTITSFTCNTSNGMLNSVDFVVGYSNGLFSPSVPNLFINGITASGQLGQRYTFGGFDANNSTLSVQDNASRSTYFVWDFRQACATPSARISVESVILWQAQIQGNPVRDELVVLVTEAQGQSLQLELVDVTGLVVASRPVRPTSNRHREVFDVQQRPAGVLLLRVAGEGRSQSLKVIKQ